MPLIEKTPGALTVALVAVFASLYVALSLLPGLPTPGDPTGQIKIEIEASLAPLYGIILGPYLGFLAAFLGTLLAWVLPPNPGDIISLPALFCPAVDALSVGLLLRGRWREAMALLGAFILAYWLSPICLPLPAYWHVGLAGSFDKLIALGLVWPTWRGLTRLKLGEEAKGLSELAGRSGLLFSLAFIGNEADSALGCATYAFFLVHAMGLPVDVVRFYYTFAPLAYFIMRLIQAAIATAVGVPLLRGLARARMGVLMAI